MAAHRPDADRRLSLAAALTAGVAVAALVAAKSVRDALFLSSFPASDLPKAMIAADVLSGLVAWGMTRSLFRRGPGRAVPLLFAGHGALFVSAWALSHALPRATAALLFVHTSALGGAVISAFWSLMSEWFDPHAAKRWFGRIGSGASAGAVVGGLSTWSAADHVSPRDLLLAIAVANAGCAVGLSRVQRGGVASGGSRDGPPDSPRAAHAADQTRYVWSLAGFVALVSCTDILIEFSFKAWSATSYQQGAGLLALFAGLHTAVGVVSFLLQSFATRPVLARFGLTTAAASLPAVTVLASTGALLFPGLLSVGLLRFGNLIAENSVFRAAYELAYTPVSTERRRSSKVLIDVGVHRSATLLGSGFCALVVGALGGAAGSAAVMGAVVCSLGALALTPGLHRGYVETLAANLKAGAVRLRDDDILDATTRQTVADTLGMNRQSLLAQAEAWWKEHAEQEQGDAADTVAREDERARAALLGGVTLTPDLFRPATRLLGQDSWLTLALPSLRAVADTATSSLAASLTDPGQPVAVRRRIPRVLRAATNQAAADALIRGLADQDFEVRYRCAIAIVQLHSAQPDLQVSRDDIVAAALRETERGPFTRTGNSLAEAVEQDDAATLLDEVVASRLGRSLAYVFTLLGVVLDREPLHLSLAAIASDDKLLRGTGLEYLDAVLPEGLRRALSVHLEDRTVVRKTVRPQQDIVEDLLRSRATLGTAVRRTTKAEGPV